MPPLPPTITKIQATIAHKMDASPRVVSEWRLLWKTWTVRLNALGAACSFVIGVALWIAPLLGVIWEGALPLGTALIVSGILFTAAVIARYLTQPDLHGDDQK